MTTTAKWVLGAATILPNLYGLLLFQMVLQRFFGGDIATPFPHYLLFVHVGFIVWMFGLMVIYYCNVNSNNHVPDDKKPLWTLLIFFGNIGVMPVYWYLFVFSENQVPSGEGGRDGRK